MQLTRKDIDILKTAQQYPGWTPYRGMATVAERLEKSGLLMLSGTSAMPPHVNYVISEAGKAALKMATPKPDLTKEMREFLERLRQKGGSAKPLDCGYADRNADKTRQKCRQLELATFSSGYWRITPSGEDAIAPKVNGLTKTEIKIEVMRNALTSVIDWAQTQCPCTADSPSICPLCGAEAAKAGDKCRAVAATFPKALLGKLKIALDDASFD